MSDDSILEIRISNKLYIDSQVISQELWKWIRLQLTVPNFQFQLLKKIGKSTWNIPAEFLMYSQLGMQYVLPRGFLGDLLRHCNLIKQPYRLIDQRVYKEKIDTTTFGNITLRPYQSETLEKVANYHFGLIVAPPGSGKTVMGIELFKRLAQPCLILVHRKELLDQWVERIESFLNIDKKDIGIIGSGKKKFSDIINVGTIQTIYTMLDKPEMMEMMENKFGLIIIDECHHIPANTFARVIEKFAPFYMFGLTATPQRKNKDEKLIFLRIGQIITYVNPQQDTPILERKKIKVIIKETNLALPFDYSEHNYEMLLRVVIFDSQRNQQIVNDVLKELKNNKNILILTERKDHVELLNMYLEHHCNVVTLTGDYSKTERAKKLGKVRKNDFDVLIATGQLMGEGVDISNLDCLFLVFPFSFEGKLIQYIGRIQRSKTEQIIYDYKDSKVEFLDKMFKKRYQYYDKI
jgi:superfamily II DNA or RNA helicase